MSPRVASKSCESVPTGRSIITSASSPHTLLAKSYSAKFVVTTLSRPSSGFASFAPLAHDTKSSTVSARSRIILFFSFFI